MLSFLRDSENTSKQKTGPGQQPHDETSPQQAPEFVITAQPKKLRNSTILLMVLFGIGLLCIFFMIKKSTPSSASANPSGGAVEQAQIEAAIAKLTGVKSEMFGGLERIIEKFGSMGNVRNIQVKDLSKNPFRMEKFGKLMDEMLGSQLNNDASSMEDHIRQQARTMQLVSIMSDARGNCCMIDDKILYEGDSIGNLIIRKISNSSVKLESVPNAKLNSQTEAVQIVLELTNDNQNQVVK